MITVKRSVTPISRVQQFLSTRKGKELLEVHGFRRSFDPLLRRAESNGSEPSVTLHLKGLKHLGKPSVKLSVDAEGKLLIKRPTGTLLANAKLRHLGAELGEYFGFEHVQHKESGEF